ncbi:hypothetical protein CH330_03035, partial [candidate division WOR-3 bacterium JGI_Cruoil_03_51_56]
SKYGHILVSARSDRVPIPCYGYGASDYYAVGKRWLSLILMRPPGTRPIIAVRESLPEFTLS